MTKDADIGALMLSRRAEKLLSQSGIKTASKLVNLTTGEWRQIKAGRETMIEIMAAVIMFARADIDEGFKLSLRNAWRDKSDAEQFRRIRELVVAGITARELDRIQKGQLP